MFEKDGVDVFDWVGYTGRFFQTFSVCPASCSNGFHHTDILVLFSKTCGDACSDGGFSNFGVGAGDEEIHGFLSVTVWMAL